MVSINILNIILFNYLRSLCPLCCIGGVFPLDQILDNLEQPLSFLFLFLLGREQIRMRRRIGSSTICENITARAAARGRRAHHRCSVLGCPCRMDFSRAEALLMASSGRATSMSFFCMSFCGVLSFYCCCVFDCAAIVLLFQ